MKHNNKKTGPGSRLLIYFLIGLMVDTILISMSILYDTLESLNNRYDSIFISGSWRSSHMITAYFSIFLPLGILITIFLFLFCFLYKKNMDISAFILTKVDFLMVIWFTLVYPVFFNFYARLFLGQNIYSHDKFPLFYKAILSLVLLFSAMMLISSLLHLYVKKRAITLPLHLFRILLAVLILPLLVSALVENAGITWTLSMQPSLTSKKSESADKRDFNVLLITIDTLRADKLSCYNFRKHTSPNIDALSKKGFIFDHAFSASNSTKPSTASIITSLYPGKHKILGPNQKLSEKLTCLPERFRAAAYHTAVFAGNPNVCPDFGFDQGVEFFFETGGRETATYPALRAILTRLISLFPSRTLSRKLNAFKEQNLMLTMTNEETIYYQFMKWLGSIRYEKFFAYVHFNTPHTDYDPPIDFDIFAENPSYKVVRTGHHTDKNRPEEEISRLISLYYGEILYVDHMIGRIIKALRNKALLESTIIVLTADHGEEFYDHGKWGHGHSLYNELIHVPLIFYIPDFPSPPARIQHYVSNIDIGPTLLSLLGLPMADGVDGKDITPLLKCKNRNVRDYIFSQQGLRSTIIKGRYKYIELDSRRMGKKTRMLFDLENDFLEENPLPEVSGDIHAKIQKALAGIQKDIASFDLPAETITLSREKTEQLRQLGYLD